jgi:hypothetical protein
METTNQSAGSAHTDTAPTATVTSLSARSRASGKLTSEARIPTSMSFGSLSVTLSGSEVTATRLRYPWSLLPTSSAIHEATRLIHTSGGPAINVFATGAWRLLIASMTITMPSVEDGAAIVSVQSATWVALKASLFAQDPRTGGSSSRVSSAWHALVRVEDAEQISWFLRTVVDLSSQRAETFPRFEEFPFGEQPRDE